MKPSDRIWRFIEWDYGRGLATEWRRLGRCNGCNDCCHGVITYDLGSQGVRGRWACMTNHVSDPHGVWLEAQSDDGIRYFIRSVKIDRSAPKVCGALVSGSCRRHAQKAIAGPLCDVWPLHPAHVDPFEHCSYRFEKVQEWHFDAH